MMQTMEKFWGKIWSQRDSIRRDYPFSPRTKLEMYEQCVFCRQHFKINTNITTMSLKELCVYALMKKHEKTLQLWLVLQSKKKEKQEKAVDEAVDEAGPSAPKRKRRIQYNWSTVKRIEETYEGEVIFPQEMIELAIYLTHANLNYWILPLVEYTFEAYFQTIGVTRHLASYLKSCYSQDFKYFSKIDFHNEGYRIWCPCLRMLQFSSRSCPKCHYKYSKSDYFLQNNHETDELDFRTKNVNIHLAICDELQDYIYNNLEEIREKEKKEEIELENRLISNYL